MTPVQQRLLAMLEELIALCDQHGLVYYAAGGTTLGAVRHKGFIPWDDDVDVMMPNEDWEKLVSIAREGNLPPDRALCCRELYDDYPNAFGRYVDLTSSFIHPNQMLGGTPEGLAIDIFPLDPVPNAHDAYAAHRETLALYSDLANPLGYSYPMVSDYGLLKSYEGRIAREGRQAVLDELERQLEKHPANSDYLVMRWGAAPRLFERTLFEPNRLEPFEHLQVRVPGRCADYLIYHYGDDWAQLPPKAGRITHDEVACSLDVGYKALQDDYLPHVDARKAERAILRRRSYHIAHVDELRRQKDLTCTVLSAFARRVTAERAGRSARPLDELLAEGEFAALDHIFAEFYRWQTSKELEGREEYLHIYRYHHPVFIDIGDALLAVALLNLVDTNRVALAARILRVARASGHAVAGRLAEVEALVRDVREPAPLHDAGEDARALESARRLLARRPTNFTARLHCLQLDAHAAPGQKKALAAEGLRLFPGSGEFKKHLADAHAAHVETEGEAVAVYEEYCEALRDTTNVFVADAAERAASTLPHLPHGTGRRLAEARAEARQNVPAAPAGADEELGQRASALLGELAELLEENQIEYYLGPTSCRLALGLGGNGLAYPVLDVMTPAENLPLIAELASASAPGGRTVDSWLTNGNYPAFQVDYVDATTTFLQLDEGSDLAAHGVKISVVPMRRQAAGPRGAWRGAVEQGWKLNGYRLTKSPTPAKLAKAALARAGMLTGRERMARRLFAGCAKAYATATTAEIRTAGGGTANLDARASATARRARFGQRSYPIPVEAEGMLAQIFGPDWADVPEWRSLYGKVLAAAELPYPELERDLAEQGTSLRELFGLMRKIRLQMLPLAPDLRTRNRAILTARRSAERIEWQKRLQARDADIQKAVEAEDHEALARLIGDYEQAALAYLADGLSLCPSKRYLDLLCDHLRRKGMPKQAARLAALAPKAHYEPLAHEGRRNG